MTQFKTVEKKLEQKEPSQLTKELGKNLIVEKELLRGIRWATTTSSVRKLVKKGQNSRAQNLMLLIPATITLPFEIKSRNIFCYSTGRHFHILR